MAMAKKKKTSPKRKTSSTAKSSAAKTGSAKKSTAKKILRGGTGETCYYHTANHEHITGWHRFGNLAQRSISQ
jgi:hypothetical protein